MTGAEDETWLERQKRRAAERAQQDRADDVIAQTSMPADLSDPFSGVTGYGPAALASIAGIVAAAPEGERNDTVYKAAVRLYRLHLGGHVDKDEVTVALLRAADDAGLTSETDRRQTRGSLKSAWDYAVTQGPAHPAERETPAPQVDPDTGEMIDMETMLVQAKLRELRVLEKARGLLSVEQYEREFREPPSVLTLREQLLLPRAATTYAVEGLLTYGGNALLTAQYKTGKTTILTALAKAFADGVPFLGRYKVNTEGRRLAIFNYELSQAQFDDWLDEAAIVEQDRVSVLHLRGYRMPLTAAKVEDWIASWLKDHDVEFWIADPFARAAVGTDENSNTEVGTWLDTFDVIKERAGVPNAVLSTHTGRMEMEAGQERARGATRLDDWADVRWLLTKDDSDVRFFRATGRDVEVPEERLTYDVDTRSLRIGGGDRQWEARRQVEAEVLAYVTAHPGCGVREIRESVARQGARVDSALAGLRRDHYIRVEDGPGKKEPHYPTGKEYPL